MNSETVTPERERVSNRCCLTTQPGSIISLAVIGISSLPWCTICRGAPSNSPQTADVPDEELQLNLGEAKFLIAQLQEYVNIREAYLAAHPDQARNDCKTEIIEPLSRTQRKEAGS